MRERPRLRVAVALAVSLALNALVFLLAAGAGAFEAPRAARRAQVALAPVDASRWAANRAITSDRQPRPQAAPALPPPPAPKAREEEDPKGQVVDVAPSKDSRRSDDARFLSERDSRVDKETRSRHAGRGSWENTLPAPSTGKDAPPRPQAGDGGAGERSTPGEERPKGARGTGADRLALPDQAGQERLALAPGGDRVPGVRVPPRGDVDRVPGAGKDLRVPGPPEAGEGGERKAGEDVLALSTESMERILGGPSPDHLDGVDEGEATALNTRGFKYATFMNRVVDAIFDVWRTGVRRAYDARDPERRMFAYQDRTTWIGIVLDPSGNLEAVNVLQGSGLDFLDEQVVRAARAAAPFPNPPEGIVRDGKIKLTLGYTLIANAPPRIVIRRFGE